MVQGKADKVSDLVGYTPSVMDDDIAENVVWERDQAKLQVLELEQAAAYDEAAIAVLQQRIGKAREILETAVRVNSVSIKRIRSALEVLEGK